MTFLVAHSDVVTERLTPPIGLEFNGHWSRRRPLVQRSMQTLEHLTGFSPLIFEPANAGDTGAYGAIAVGSTTAFLGLAYGTVGGWGTLQLPFQFFVTARRPENQSGSLIAGYGTGFGDTGLVRSPISISRFSGASSAMRISPYRSPGSYRSPRQRGFGFHDDIDPNHIMDELNGPQYRLSWQYTA